MLAPKLSSYVEYFRESYNLTSTSDILFDRIISIYNKIQKIKPYEIHSDKTWTVWVEVDRGTIDEFGDIEDFEDEKDRKETFESYYPDEKKWYQISLVQFSNQISFHCEKLVFFINIDDKKFNQINIEDYIEPVSFLLDKLEEKVDEVIQDPESYNKYLSENLPLKHRFGKIKRSVLWNYDFYNINKELGQVDKFEEFVKNNDNEAVYTGLTLKEFLTLCEICYDANEKYYTESTMFGEARLKHDMTIFEKYTSMADSRDGGLLKVAPDQPNALRDWYLSGEWQGCHPWEICRGGNSTHINLSLTFKENIGWKIYLVGFSDSRAVETAKMAIALYEKGIRFELLNAEEMLLMFKGEDNYGILPDGITPRYCHQLFNKEDNVFSFFNFNTILDVYEKIKDNVVWYPLKRLELVI